MSPDAMKAEIGYPDVVMGDFIEDLIGDIEYNMGLVPARRRRCSVPPSSTRSRWGKTPT